MVQAQLKFHAAWRPAALRVGADLRTCVGFLDQALEVTTVALPPGRDSMNALRKKFCAVGDLC